jgi:hypothetical protein
MPSTLPPLTWTWQTECRRKYRFLWVNGRCFTPFDTYASNENLQQHATVTMISTQAVTQFNDLRISAAICQLSFDPPSLPWRPLNAGDRRCTLSLLKQ